MVPTRQLSNAGAWALIFLTSALHGNHGTAKSARDFLRALLACHQDVKVIAPDREEFPESMCGHRLAKPVWFPAPAVQSYAFKDSFNVGRVWSRWLDNRRRLQAIRTMAGGESVIVNGWNSCAVWESLCQTLTGRSLVIIRESPRHFDSPESARNPHDAALAHRTLADRFSAFDELLFVSKNVQREWRQYDSLSSKPSYVLPNCCEEEEVRRVAEQPRDLLRRSLGLSSNEFVVLCAGPIQFRKGQDILLRVLSNLAESIDHFRLLLVGNPIGEFGHNLLDSFRDHEFADRVTHWNARDTILDALCAADLLAFPSRAEALPRTILEAMALRIPVVAFGVDGVPELIVDGQSGILADVNDERGFCDGIIRLANDPQFAAQATSAGQEIYWRDFSRSLQFSRLEKIISSFSPATTPSR